MTMIKKSITTKLKYIPYKHETETQSEELEIVVFRTIKDGKEYKISSYEFDYSSYYLLKYFDKLFEVNSFNKAEINNSYYDICDKYANSNLFYDSYKLPELCKYTSSMLIFIEFYSQFHNCEINFEIDNC